MRIQCPGVSVVLIGHFEEQKRIRGSSPEKVFIQLECKESVVFYYYLLLTSQPLVELKLKNQWSSDFDRVVTVDVAILLERGLVKTVKKNTARVITTV